MAFVAIRSAWRRWTTSVSPLIWAVMLVLAALVAAGGVNSISWMLAGGGLVLAR